MNARRTPSVLLALLIILAVPGCYQPAPFVDGGVDDAAKSPGKTINLSSGMDTQCAYSTPTSGTPTGSLDFKWTRSGMRDMPGQSANSQGFAFNYTSSFVKGIQTLSCTLNLDKIHLDPNQILYFDFKETNNLKDKQANDGLTTSGYTYRAYIFLRGPSTYVVYSTTTAVEKSLVAQGARHIGPLVIPPAGDYTVSLRADIVYFAEDSSKRVSIESMSDSWTISDLSVTLAP